MSIEDDVQLLVQQTQQLDTTVKEEMGVNTSDIISLRKRVTKLEIPRGIPSEGSGFPALRVVQTTPSLDGDEYLDGDSIFVADRSAVCTLIGSAWVCTDAASTRITHGSALPTSGMGVGDMHFNQVDGRIYIYIEGQWQEYEVAAAANAANVSTGTTADRPQSPNENYTYFNTTTGKIEIFKAGAWVEYEWIQNSGDTGVTVGSELPTTPNEGDVHFNDADNQIHIYRNGGWTAYAWGNSGINEDTAGIIAYSTTASLPANVPTGTVAFITELDKLAVKGVSGWTTELATLDLGPNSITTSAIATGAVIAEKIAANAVTAVKLAADSVTAESIAADTITADQIAAGTITGLEIKTNTIAADNIATGAITADLIAANAITAVHIKTGAISADMIDTSTITVSSFVNDAGYTNDSTANSAYSLASTKVSANQVNSNVTNISGGVITTGTIYANKIVSGDIAVALHVHAGGPFIGGSSFSDISYHNSTEAGRITISNAGKSIPLKVVINGAGRVFQDGAVNGHFYMHLYDSSNTSTPAKYIGAAPSTEVSKAFTLGVTIPAYATKTYILKYAHQSTVGTIGLSMDLTVLGVRN